MGFTFPVPERKGVVYGGYPEMIGGTFVDAEIWLQFRNCFMYWRWQKARRALIRAKRLVDHEMDVRKNLAAALFPTPKEGANKVVLSNGIIVKYTHQIDRKLDEGVLKVNADLYKAAQINVDNIIRTKPELRVKEWRELSDEQKLVFADAITEKPSTITLEVVLPKRT